MKKLLLLILIMVSFCIMGGTISNAETLGPIETQRRTANLVQTLDKIKYNNVLNPSVVKVVSGLEYTYEPTFDTYRIISGEAQQGTNVGVWKYKKTADNRVVLNEITLHTIGASEIFSDLIELDLGKNYILIQGNNGVMSTAAEYCLNRKDASIKRKLKAMPLLFNSNTIGLGFFR